MIAILLMTALISSASPQPAYVMEVPGIAFGWLPREINPPVEGALGTESGTLVSGPGSQGYDYRIHYWRLDTELSTTDRALWLRQKLESHLPPDVLESVVFGSMNWLEGSTAVAHLNLRSVGLCAAVNFNMVSGGSVLFRGRAVGIFRDGYAVLVYGMAPMDARPAVTDVIDMIMANAWMSS